MTSILPDMSNVKCEVCGTRYNLTTIQSRKNKLNVRVICRPCKSGPRAMVRQQSTETLHAALDAGIAAPGSALESWLKEALRDR